MNKSKNLKGGKMQRLEREDKTNTNLIAVKTSLFSHHD